MKIPAQTLPAKNVCVHLEPLYVRQLTKLIQFDIKFRRESCLLFRFFGLVYGPYHLLGCSRLFADLLCIREVNTSQRIDFTH